VVSYLARLASRSSGLAAVVQWLARGGMERGLSWHAKSDAEASCSLLSGVEKICVRLRDSCCDRLRFRVIYSVFSQVKLDCLYTR
jgi:hypothetical protein